MLMYQQNLIIADRQLINDNMNLKTSLENTTPQQKYSSPRWSATEIAAICIFLVLAVAILGYFDIKRQFSEAREAAQIEISAVADLKVSQIESWYENHLRDAGVIFNNQIVREKAIELLSGSKKVLLQQELLEWMKNRQKNHEYKQMILFDSKGVPLLSVPKALPAFDISHNKYFQAAILSDTVLPIDLHRDDYAWKYIHLSIYIPVGIRQGEDGRAKGAWMIQIDPYKLLYPLIQTWPSARYSAETLLVRREGNNILFLNELRHRKNTALKLRIPFDPKSSLPAALAVSEQKGIVEGIDYRDVPVLADIRSIPGTDWFMVAKIDQKEIYTAARRQSWQSGAILLTLLLFCFAGVGFILKQQNNRTLKQQLADEHERRITAEALYESRQKTAFFANLLEKSSQPFAVSYSDGRISLFNNAFAKLLDRSREEIENIKQPNHFTHPEWIESELSALKELYITGNPIRYEKEYIRKDGLSVPVELLVHLVRDEKGLPDYYYAFITDISERKAAEKALRDSKNRLQLALRTAKFGIYNLNLITGKATTDSEYAVMTGLDSSDILATVDEFFEKVHPDDCQNVRKIFESCLQGKLPIFRAEFRLRSKSGRWVWILSVGKIIEWDSEGNPIEMLGIHGDITEQKEAEENLKKSERLLKETQKISHIGGWEYDVESERMFWSDEVYNIHGVSKEYDPSNPDFETQFYLPEDRGKTIKAFRRLLENGESYDLIIRSIKADGTLIWVRTSGHAEQNEGKIIRAFGNIMDITKQKQAEEKMLAANEEIQKLLKDAEESRHVLLSIVEDQQESQRQIQKLNAELEKRVQERTARLEEVIKELESFSYSVSHDLRSPLQHMTGFAQLLGKRANQILDEKSRHYLEIIIDSTARMGSLIDDLLSFSRMGRSEMMKKNVNIGSLVSEVINDFKIETKERDIEWKISPLPDVTGDPAMLKLVFANLISNALKFTNERNRAIIEIGSMPDIKDEICLYVKDNGAGFDMKYVDKLFGIFQRLHRNDEFEGTGIGLANVRRIIHRHGGKTWAKGAVDMGATFYFSLPGPQEPV